MKIEWNSNSIWVSKCGAIWKLSSFNDGHDDLGETICAMILVRGCGACQRGRGCTVIGRNFRHIDGRHAYGDAVLNIVREIVP